MKSSIVSTDDETNYPTKEGWKKIPSIHRSNIFLYVCVKQDETLDVIYRWNSVVSSRDIGIGIKRGKDTHKILYLEDKTEIRIFCVQNINYLI